MRTINSRDLQYLLLIAALPVLGYHFGFGNQVEQLSLVARMDDPSRPKPFLRYKDRGMRPTHL